MPMQKFVKLLQFVEASALVPWCRNKPFDAVHKSRGSGAEPGMDWCETCIKRSPLAVSRMLTLLADEASLVTEQERS